MDAPSSQLPPWFQRLGTAAWLVVGMVLVVVGAIWLVGRTSSIANPLIAGAVIAAVAGRDRRPPPGTPRAAALGAAVVILGLVAVGALTVVAVLGGITSQAGHIDGLTSEAVDKVRPG